MKKILVVFTGGTIGSKIDGTTIDVDQAMNRVIINGFFDAYPNIDVQFDAIQPFNILSENFTPRHWKILSNAIIDATTNNEYCGIIITHGSDTISYTSAYIGFMFANASIPILLTCSNYVLSSPLSNGQNNFNNCVFAILYGNIKGVFALYQNNQKQNLVYIATRLQEADPYNDQFSVCGGVSFGEIIDKKLILNPKFDADKFYKPHPTIKLDSFTNQVCAIKAYPGLNYHNYSFSPNTKAVLCNLYHSSSNCIDTEEFSLTNFISKCVQQNIDVYLMSFKTTMGEMYNTTKRIIESGGIPLLNISFESAYVKLNIAYNQTEVSGKEFMKKVIFHENIFE